VHKISLTCKTAFPILNPCKRKFLSNISHIGKAARNSILQENLKGRKSETELPNGLVVQKGQTGVSADAVE